MNTDNMTPKIQDSQKDHVVPQNFPTFVEIIKIIPIQVLQVV